VCLAFSETHYIIMVMVDMLTVSVPLIVDVLLSKLKLLISKLWKATDVYSKFTMALF